MVRRPTGLGFSEKIIKEDLKTIIRENEKIKAINLSNSKKDK